MPNAIEVENLTKYYDKFLAVDHSAASSRNQIWLSLRRRSHEVVEAISSQTRRLLRSSQ